MARKSSTPRTLSLLRSFGWKYWRVESFNAFSGHKNDLFNIIDYLVITDCSTIGIQSCGADFASHITKLCIDEKENTIDWLKCNNRLLLLIGWRKILRKRGGKLRIYKPRIAHIYIDNDDLVFEEKNTNYYGVKKP